MNRFEAIENQTRKLPAWQSPEIISRLITETKPGDIVRIVPKGGKKLYISNAAALNASFFMFCVDERLSEDTLRMWVPHYKDKTFFNTPETQTFTLEDIQAMTIDRREIYIPAATQCLFHFATPAHVYMDDGKHVVIVQKYFMGNMEGKTFEGQLIVKDLTQFEPINRFSL